MESLAFTFPLTPGKAEEWRYWGQEMLVGARRSEYHTFRRRLGFTVQRMYLQRTPRGDTAIIYLEGDDLQRALKELRTLQGPFAVWFRQQAKDPLNGLDLTQTSPGSLSELVFDGPSPEEDEGNYRKREEMQRLGMISP